MPSEKETMKSGISHVHERKYLGEDSAGWLLDWLNLNPSKFRGGKPNTVEKLLGLICEAEECNHVREFEEKCDKISRITRSLRLTFEPDLQQLHWSRGGKKMPKSVLKDLGVPLDIKPWTFTWVPRGDKKASYFLARALVALFELASLGLARRIRKCSKPTCGKWFLAKFEHQLFDSKACQEQAFHARPSWKQKRAAYMREARRRDKLKQQAEERIFKRRG